MSFDSPALVSEAAAEDEGRKTREYRKGRVRTSRKNRMNVKAKEEKKRRKTKVRL